MANRKKERENGIAAANRAIKQAAEKSRKEAEKRKAVTKSISNAASNATKAVAKTGYTAAKKAGISNPRSTRKTQSTQKTFIGNTNARNARSRGLSTTYKPTTTASVMKKYQRDDDNNRVTGNDNARRGRTRGLSTNFKPSERSSEIYKKSADGTTSNMVRGITKGWAGGTLTTASTLLDLGVESNPIYKTLNVLSPEAYDTLMNGKGDTKGVKDVIEQVGKLGADWQHSAQKHKEKALEGKSGLAKYATETGWVLGEIGLDFAAGGVIGKALKGAGLAGKAINSATKSKGIKALLPDEPALSVMASRAFGAGKQSAIDEGASEKQANLYGIATAAIEVATEKFGQVAAPLRRIYGKGATDKIFDSLLDRVVNKTTSKLTKNTLYHGGKVLGSAVTEGLEEMVSEGLEPFIANAIYANAIGKPHEFSWEDVLYAGALGAGPGAILGGVSEVGNYSQGKAIMEAKPGDTVTNIFGEGGLKSIIKQAKKVDDAAIVSRANAIDELVNEGEPIAAGQAAEMYRAVQEQTKKDVEQLDIVNQSANNIIKRENLIVPFTRNVETQRDELRPTTLAKFEDTYNKSLDTTREMQADITEADAAEIAGGIAAIDTGIAGIEEVDLFMANDTARTVYESVTGKALPETNEATRQTLFNEIGKNRVISARAETAAYSEEVKAYVQKNESAQYESNGQTAFAELFGDADFSQIDVDSERTDQIDTFNDYYRAGRSGITIETVANMNNPVHRSLSPEMREAAWVAGQNDLNAVLNDVKGQPLSAGEKVVKNGVQANSAVHRGKVVIETTAREHELTSKEQYTVTKLADIFNIELHIVDELPNDARGEYHSDGRMYISMSADRPWQYVFSHEIAHHMQKYAPAEYQEIKEFIRRKWTEKGGLDEAVHRKQYQYGMRGVELTYEEAFDEIIADSIFEVVNDETVIDDVVTEKPSLGKRILEAVKELIRKIRLLLSNTGISETYAEGILSELDIVKEIEQKWNEGLRAAAENGAAIENIDSTQKTRYSMAKPFSEQIDDVINKKHDPKLDLWVMNTPKALIKAGLPTGPLLMRNSKVGKILKKHSEMSAELLKKLPEAIENPITIIRSKTFPKDSAVVISEILTSKGNMIVPIWVKREGNYIDANGIEQFVDTNFAASAYGRNVKGLLEYALKSDGFLYVSEDNKKVEQLFARNGLQLPTPLKLSNFNDIIHDNSEKSKRFSLKDPIEETNNLIAQHNISVDNLRKAFNLGGFPMPSIAITKGDVGHTNFGDVSLIFDKATIDPADRRNKVYGSDAWTPTFPAIEYEMNEDKAEEIYNRAEKVGYIPHFNPASLAPANIQDRMRGRGESGLINTLRDDYSIKQMYLAETGKGYVEPVLETKRTEISGPDREAAQWFMENAGELYNSYESMSNKNENPLKWKKEHLGEIRNAYERYLIENGLDSDTASSVVGAMKNLELTKPLLNAKKIKAGKDVTETTEENIEKTYSEIDSKIKLNQKEYDEWVSELFEGIETDSGVWNGKDPYTDMGDRRSFASTHYPVTLDNIVSAMLDQADSVRNADSMFVGTKTVRAAATKEFDSIEGIKKASGKIQKINTEEYDALKDDLDNRLSEVMTEIAQSAGEDNYFRAMDSVGYAIEEACSKPTPENIKNKLAGYGFNATDAQAQEINDIINEVVDMPVNMFEAKPLRAVGFDEVKAAVVPSDIDTDVKTELSNRGIDVFEYERDNDADRIEKVNAVAEEKNVRFSLREDDNGTQYTLIDAKDITVEDMNENDSLPKRARAYMREHFRGAVLPVGKTKRAYMRREAEGEYTNPAKGIDDKTYNDKLLAVTELQNMLKGSKFLHWSSDRGTHKDAVRGWNYYETIFATKDDDGKTKVYRGEVLIKRIARGDVFYDITKIKEITDGHIGRGVAAHAESTGDSVNGSIIQNDGKVNTRYSFPDDTEIYDYIYDHETEFVDVPPVKDYEAHAVRVKNETRGELLEQVRKLKLDRKLTKGRILDEKSVREAVNSLIRSSMIYSESYTSDGMRRKTNRNLVREGTHAVSEIFTAMKDGDYLQVINIADLSAQYIAENLEIMNDGSYNKYLILKDYLKNTRLIVSEEDASNIPDFSNFRKQYRNKIRIVSEHGTSVDSAYTELREILPGVFPEYNNPGDQLQAIAEALDNLEPYQIMLSSDEMLQLQKEISQKLIEIAASGKAYKTLSDKYDEKLRLVKARQKEAIRDVRKKATERANERIASAREKANEQIAEAREKAEEKVRKAHEQRDEKIKEVRDSARRREKERREKAVRETYLQSIEYNRNWILQRLKNPTNAKHVPEGLKSALSRLIASMDMQSQQSRQYEKRQGYRAKRWNEMDELRARLASVALEDDSGAFVYDEEIFSVIDELADNFDGRIIPEFTTDELFKLDNLMKYVTAQIRNENKLFDENLKGTREQIASQAIEAANQRRKNLKNGEFKNRSGMLRIVDDILNESMVTPRDFFERLGGGMEKAFMSLRRGLDKRTMLVAESREFFDEMFADYGKKDLITRRNKPGSAIEDWRDGKTAKEFDCLGGKIKLTVAQRMSLYCLAHREAALSHIYGTGIVASHITPTSKIARSLGAKEINSNIHVQVSEENVREIINSLTEEQKLMAEQMQEFLATECADWGNEVSMTLYGYKKFTDRKYFPMQVLSTQVDSRADLKTPNTPEKIKNFGFTKEVTPNATNVLVIDDIFSVFANHVNKMSLYNAFAVPITDFMRIYNYRARDAEGNIVVSVQDAIERAYGKKANDYITNFIADLNGQTQIRADGFNRFITKSLANYKKAAIGGNLRVAFQQPTAISRAFMLISPKYFVKLDQAKMIKNLRDMKEHCPIALWKSWGYSQVDMAQDLDDIMMNREWSKVDRATMEIYGALDNMTWSSIWAAVRNETKKLYPDVTVNSEEFYRICNDRASEIFDKTQVVDSVFHRSQVMRRQDTMSKMLTSFMAEPTRTYNMMRTAYAQAADLWASGKKGKATKLFTRANSVYIVNALTVSAAAAVADALRGKVVGDDDDDDELWLQNFISNAIQSLNPLGLLPVVKDLVSAAEGWSVKNMALEGWAGLVGDLAKNKGPRDIIEDVGYITGFPFKNILRDVEAVLRRFGVNVYAAETEDGEVVEEGFFTQVGKLLADKFFPGHDDKAEETDETEDKYYREPDAEKRRAEIAEKVAGLPKMERQEKLWGYVTENYTHYLAAGDIETIREMRDDLEALGGDMNEFEEKINKKATEYFKKTIGDPELRIEQAKLRSLLLEMGNSPESISRNIICKTDMAKEFQKAMCESDDDAAVNAVYELLEAGISEDDIYYLYNNRTKGVDAEDYASGKMVAPVTGEITSGFGYRTAPTKGASTDHKGIDIAVPIGTDVKAADGGVIEKAGWDGGKGISVVINHGNGTKTEYNHLSGYMFYPGTVVSAGDVIAKSGSTGVSTGPHLDFRIKVGNRYEDPMYYLQ
jgi:murein DD-endopeptidase MepM/ murein hydrolase activator NlpD/vacuolar-type H+-ATPase subunit H